MTITVFSTGPSCHRCTLVKNQLKKNEIPFEEIRLDEDATWHERVTSYGFMNAPVVLIDDDNVWEGFASDELKELIADYRAMAA